MYYQKVLEISGNIPYLSVGFDVSADFIWVPIMLPNGILIGELFKITYSDPQSHELAILKVKEAQEMYFLESHYFPESTEVYHIPLLCFLRDKGLDYAVTNPITTKNSTNMNVRKPHNSKFDLKKAAKVGLDASLKASIVPDGTIADLRNPVRDYYYLKDLQFAIALKLHAELRVSFPVYLDVFNKVTTQTFLKPLEAHPLAADMPTAPKDGLVGTVRSTAHLEETCILVRYDAICIVAKGAAVLGRALPSNVLRIRLYIKMYREYQAHLDNILEELHRVVGKLERALDYDHISFIQTLRGVGSLSAVVLTAKVESSGLLPSPKKLYAYFGLDPDVNDSGEFHEGRVYTSKRGSSPARRTPHMVTTSNPRMDKATKASVDPAIHDHYTRKCASKKRSAAVGAVMHEICNIIFVMLRGNKPSEFITPEEHRERYAAEHPESMNITA